MIAGEVEASSVAANPLAHCWVPTPRAWRHIPDGATFVGGDGKLWELLAKVATADGSPAVQVRCGKLEPPPVAVDPDEQVLVLVPMVERDALELLACAPAAGGVGAVLTAPVQAGAA